MSSRIKKAKQIVDGKSKFKTAKKLEEDKIKIYVDTIKSFSKTLPDHLKTATCHNNQFEFFLSYHRGLKVIIDSNGPAIKSVRYSSVIIKETFVEKILLIEKIDNSESQVIFEANRERLLQLIGKDLLDKIDSIIKDEFKRRGDINKATAMPSPPKPPSPYQERYRPYYAPSPAKGPFYQGPTTWK